MVRTRATLGDQLIAHTAWKWQVSDAVAVEMAELPSANPELDPAESVWRRLHTGPGLHDRRYLFACVHGYAH